ncbi:hypothetical protein [Fundidesulfovibrio putealis]|uniref:hypothetical protein n=1 Tax=Fundidesulfovibrio putealis TaxID=270496 RepID=UPI000405E4E9|nr:hypothetical protein [Fundidesulfovibrio putealis]
MFDASPDSSLTHLWLPSLIKAQAIMDVGVRLAIRHESAVRGEAPACREQCAGCCSSRHMAATSLEIAGAAWHLKRESSPRSLAALDRLWGNGPDEGGEEGCPLLVDGVCAAYSMRFLSCRQLVVFGRSCSMGEDPFRTRRADVLTPLRTYAFKAYSLLLPHLGVIGMPGSPGEMDALLAGLTQPVRAHGGPVHICAVSGVAGARAA